MRSALKHIFAIAHAERLIIFRTAKFWVLSGIGFGIVSLFIFVTTIVTIVENNPPGEFMLQGTDALLAMYLFSFLQAILIIFIASDFRKSEDKAMLDQVMYSRPMNTASWVVGKYLGVVGSVLYLNLGLILLASVGRIFKWYFIGASIGLMPAFQYILIATIPAILFMTSLVFFLVSLLRFQALAIIIPLGYVISIFFYFHNKFLSFFDYGCFFVPLFASDLIGFGDLGTLVTQRIFYTVLSFVLLFFSIVLFPRPRQNRWLHRIIGFSAVLLLTFATFIVFRVYKQNKHKMNEAETALAYQKALQSEPVCRVANYDFDLRIFQGKAPLDATVKLGLKNENKEPIEKAIFSLNQSLHVSRVALQNGDEVRFQHENHVLQVFLSPPLQLAEERELIVSYSGVPDADAFMLDRLPDQDFLVSMRDGPFLKKPLSSWIGDEYVVLPAEVGWYPIPGVASGFGHSQTRPKNFATAHMKIHGPANLHYITQGQGVVTDSLKPVMEFRVEKPVPGFSLNAGPYTKISHQFRQAQLELYFHPQHLPDIKEFADVADTCFEAIETLFDEFENITGIKYPYPRLAFVERPTQMQVYLTTSGIQNTFLQPGVIMVNETEITRRDIKKEIENRTKRAKHRGRDDSPNKIKRDVFIDFMLEFLLPSEAWGNDGTLNSPLKNYLHFQVDIQDPVLARALEVQYYELCEKRIYDTFFPRREKRRFSSFDELRKLTSGWTLRRRYNVELDSLIQTLENQPLSQLLPSGKGGIYRATIDFKSPQILEMLRQRVGEEQWTKGIQELVNEYRCKPVNRELLLQMVQNKEEPVESDYFITWFDKLTYPGYKIISATAQKLKPRGSKSLKMAYQVRVKVRNGEEGAGFVRLVCGIKGDDYWKRLYLKSFEEQEILFPVDGKPRIVQLFPFYARNRGNIEKDVTILEGLLRQEPRDTFYVVQRSLDDSLNFVLDDQSNAFSSPVQDEAKYFRPALKGKSWQSQISDVAFGDYYLSWHFKHAGAGDYPAKWQTKVPKTGMYALYYRLPYGKRWFLRSRFFVDEISLKIHAADGEQKIKIRPFETGDDWLPIGQFYFEKGKQATIEVIDKGNGRLIADAIRWEFVN